MEFYEIIIICLYVHMSITWGLFAGIMDAKLHPDATLRRNIFCFCINLVFAPIAMTTAVLMLVGGKHDKYFIKP